MRTWISDQGLLNIMNPSTQSLRPKIRRGHCPSRCTAYGASHWNSLAVLPSHLVPKLGWTTQCKTPQCKTPQCKTPQCKNTSMQKHLGRDTSVRKAPVPDTASVLRLGTADTLEGTDPRDGHTQYIVEAISILGTDRQGFEARRSNE